MTPRNRESANNTTQFDYSNQGWPRDFDIRIEVAEQQEIIRESQQQFQRRYFTFGADNFAKTVWHTSEYDF